jgi:hypothetical protein
MNMKQLLLAAFCTGAAMSGQTVVQSSGSGVTEYLVALPHIAYGGGWRTQIVVENTNATAAGVTLYYFGDNGTPLNVAIGGVSSTSTTLTIPAYGEQVVEPDWASLTSTTEGWVGLVYSGAGLKIQGVFLWLNAPPAPAGQYTQAAAPIVSQMATACIIPLPSGGSVLTMPYDNTGGQFSGYGFANTTAAPVTLSLTFYNASGVMVGQFSEPLAAFGHDSFLIASKVPALAGTQGMMAINGLGVMPLGFRFNANYTFMTWLP